MPWPTPQDYNEAIQNPRLSFCDPELQSGAVELTALGLPRPITGNFASVYRVRCAGRDWAVRCFFREFADTQQRYAAISRHLETVGLPYTVGFEYLPRGITVRGQWYPIVKMEWVEGELLNTYVERHLQDRATLSSLARSWMDMAGTLDRASIAHGDLQHGNVLVVNGNVKLVDYDGMFVPSLAATFSHEIGHQNYQHPRRTGAEFGAALDRFSAWVIYLSLIAVAADPDLWSAGPHDEALLLTRRDFEQPDTSTVFAALKGHADPTVRELATRLRSFLEVPPLAVPSLAPRTEIDPVGEGGRRRRTLGRSKRTESAVQTLPVAAAPAWVVEQLAPAEAAAGFGPVGLPRSVLAGSIAVAMVEILLWLSPLGTLLPAPASVMLVLAAVNLVVLAWAYGREPLVVEMREIRYGERIEVRALNAIDRDVRRCRRRKERLAKGHERRRERAAVRLQMVELRERRWQVAVEGTFGDIVAMLDRRDEEIDRQERRELDAALEMVQASHAGEALRRERIRGANGPALTRWTRWRLWLAGVRTAADVNADRVGALRGIGNVDAAVVLRWRAAVQEGARRNLPRSLPPELRAAIVARYQRGRGKRRRERGEAAEQRRSLIDAIEGRRAAEERELEDGLARSARELVAAFVEIEADEVEIRRSEPVHNWRLKEARRQLEPYRVVTFRRYLRSVISIYPLKSSVT